MNYLVTGGAGSIATGLINHICKQPNPPKIIAFDNSEYALSLLPAFPNLELAIGDIRDKSRLKETMKFVDTVIHAASLKRVDMAEWNVKETIKTNVLGTINVVEACAETNVEKMLLISSDKAVPTDNFSLYGATKYLQEKIVLTAKKPDCSVARFGNVSGTRGDVLEIWARQTRENKPLTITEPNMQRYFWTMHEAVNFITHCLNIMKGGEIFVPKMTETNIMTLQQQHHPNAQVELIGMRPGEMLRHALLTPNEHSRAVEYDWGWLIS